jgi:methionyl-tRNA formyltransferase
VTEAIVHAIFQPSNVDDQTVVDILAEINNDTSLNAARGAVLSRKVAETKKYKPMVRHEMLFR